MVVVRQSGAAYAHRIQLGNIQNLIPFESRTESKMRKVTTQSNLLSVLITTNLILSAGALVSCASTQGNIIQTDTQSTPKISEEMLAIGQAAWVQGRCSKCHGDDGTGGKRGPDLTDGLWLHSDGSIEGIRAVIVAGVDNDQIVDKSRPFKMNPGTALIKDESKLEALAQFVWSMSNQQ